MKKKGLSRREFLQVGAACGLAAFTGSECSRSTEERSKLERLIVDSSLGRQPVDISGSAIGVSRMDPGESYAGTGELLQKWIRDSDQEAWSEIKAKIDYTYENLDLALSPLEAETSFSKEIKSRIKKDQKLLFKPNLVGVAHIDQNTSRVGLSVFAIIRISAYNSFVEYYGFIVDSARHFNFSAFCMVIGYSIQIIDHQFVFGLARWDIQSGHTFLIAIHGIVIAVGAE